VLTTVVNEQYRWVGGAWPAEPCKKEDERTRCIAACLHHATKPSSTHRSNNPILLLMYHNRQEEAYLSWLARCFIMTGRAAAAWQLLAAHHESSAPGGGGLMMGGGSGAIVPLLQLVGNDSYRTGQFAVALKVCRWRNGAVGRVWCWHHMHLLAT